MTKRCLFVFKARRASEPLLCRGILQWTINNPILARMYTLWECIFPIDIPLGISSNDILAGMEGKSLVHEIVYEPVCSDLSGFVIITLMDFDEGLRLSDSWYSKEG